MSQNGGPSRPSQVTAAAWTAVGASVAAVLATFQSMTDLRSLDMRDQLTAALGSSGSSGSLTVDQAISVIHGMLYVGGVAAAVAAVLGIYVLQPNPAARVALTVAAIPVVLTAPVAGLIPGMVLGLATATLWLAPARQWFAGTPPRGG